MIILILNDLNIYVKEKYLLFHYLITQIRSILICYGRDRYKVSFVVAESFPIFTSPECV